NAKLFCIKAIPGSGQGLVATTNIPMGARILAEAPIITLSDGELGGSAERLLADKLSSLSNKKRKGYFRLHNIHGSSLSPACGIFKTNALPLEDNHSSILLNACRINHACDPNALNTWNDALKNITLHAIRDINKGEEITISYMSDTVNYAARQARLNKGFGFICACRLCTLPLADRTLSDQRWDQIAALDKQVTSPPRLLFSPVSTHHCLREMLRLLREEGYAADAIMAPRTYNDAFQVAVINGDQARANVFAQRAYAARVVGYGDDHPGVVRLRGYVDNPASHPIYGRTMRWKQSVALIPKGLGKSEFED
ncbi:hypothetical protein B0H67DRAFT_472844, partial [Lasiosphaeris hirsuta]